ncbi:MAG: alpha/beta fold hydrolase [Jiangellales bacterium]
MPERPSWFDPEAFPVESRWLGLDGHCLHYVDEGSGPTLLMLHGNPTWSFLYRRLVAGLRDGFRCVALDYPGFGLSAAAPGYRFTVAEHSEVVRRFVEALDLSEVTAIVQDWGGPIGMGAAVADPDRYAGFVIGNTYAWPSLSPDKALLSELMGNRLLGGLLNQRLNLFVGRMMPFLLQRQLSDAEAAMYRGPFPTPASREPVRVLPREIRTAQPFLARVEEALPLVTDKPTLLVWGDKDIAFKQPERRRWQAMLTRRRDHTLRGAGHFWQDDAGEEAARIIRDWFAEGLKEGPDGS